MTSFRKNYFYLTFIFVLTIVAFPFDSFSNTQKSIQVVRDNLQPGESHYYLLSGLTEGEIIYINIENLSGNLDPIFGITENKADFRFFEEYFTKEIPSKLESGQEFVEVFPDFADEYFIVWDDNSGPYSDASIKFEVPASGDYQLVLSGTYYQLQRNNKFYRTFGNYRLNIGRGSPEVLKGNVKQTGEKIASQIGTFNKRVEELVVEISDDKDFVELPLNIMDKGNMLYIHAESLKGDLIPALKLRDYGDRLLAFDNLLDEKSTASLKYELGDKAENYSLIVRGDSKNKKTKGGKIKLLIGTNSPDILTGKSTVRGRPIVRESIDVEIALIVDQISDINQTKENYTVVAYLLMKWQDSKFAFNPDKCKCNEVDYTRDQFSKYIQDNNLEWPKFIILNQQGRRFVQEDNFRVNPDGEVKYFERFTVTLQAPDFNFRKFPFDPQQFFVRILSLNSVDFYEYYASDKLPSLGKHLGEEEWVVTSHESFIEEKSIINQHSEYILEINASRHINYYMFRIFLPLLLIIVVSWGTFFMQDYSNRIMVSVSNLLIFVAFNFSIGSDLPRLGYMTFMDGILFSAFLITAVTVLMNVFFRRLEIKGHENLAIKIDAYATTWYPFVYIVTIVFLVVIFLY